MFLSEVVKRAFQILYYRIGRGRATYLPARRVSRIDPAEVIRVRGLFRDSNVICNTRVRCDSTV